MLLRNCRSGSPAENGKHSLGIPRVATWLRIFRLISFALGFILQLGGVHLQIVTCIRSVLKFAWKPSLEAFGLGVFHLVMFTWGRGLSVPDCHFWYFAAELVGIPCKDFSSTWRIACLSPTGIFSQAHSTDVVSSSQEGGRVQGWESKCWEVLGIPYLEIKKFLGFWFGVFGFWFLGFKNVLCFKRYSLHITKLPFHDFW